MKNFKTFLSVATLSVIVCLSACKKDDPEVKCESGIFTMTLNGATFTATSFNNTLLRITSAGVDGKRMDIRATNDSGQQLIISFTDLSTGKNGTCMSTAAYIPIDEVMTGQGNTYLFTFIDASGVSYPIITGNLDITSCNADATQISGTFSFNEFDFDVKNGSFTNMCYKVL